MNYEQKILEYKRLSDVTTVSELENMEVNLKDRFSKIPDCVQNLIKLIKLRILATNANISAVIQAGNVIRINTPFTMQEWLILKSKIDSKVTKYYTYSTPPKTLGKVKGILLLNIDYDDFDEIFDDEDKEEELGKTASIKAATTKSTSIKLSWEAVEGADAYRVYVANNGAWKVLTKSTDKTTFTATGLTAGKKYTFAVKAFKDGVAAKTFTKATLQTAPGTTSAIKVGRGYTSIKLTWNKVSGATGYRVYQAKSGKWVQVRKSGTTNTYTVKGLKAGKSYKFAVKAYRIENGKVIWADTYKSVTAKTVAK